MSNTLIIIVLIVGVALIAILGCLVMFVMARLRRVIRLQFETIEKLLGAAPTGQSHDKPTEHS